MLDWDIQREETGWSLTSRLDFTREGYNDVITHEGVVTSVWYARLEDDEDVDITFAGQPTNGFRSEQD